MAKGPFSGSGYAGRTFFFIGRSAKKLDDLPTLDERVFRIEPGTRQLKTESDSVSTVCRRAVEEAARNCEEKGLTEEI